MTAPSAQHRQGTGPHLVAPVPAPVTQTHREGPPPNALPPFPTSSLSFVLHYVRQRWAAFGGTFLLIAGAVTCAVSVQFAVSRMVDAMAGPNGLDKGAVWGPFVLFAALIAAECALWRGAGWLGGKTIYTTGIHIRTDLFRHLSGHAMRYFSDQFAGALGGRITQTATAFSALMTAFVWAILPPTVDFVGALIVFGTVDWRMMAVLFVFVIIVVGVLAYFGARGRQVHREYAERAGAVGGELIDTISNMWAVKAFSARERERRRLSEQFASDANAQVASWLYLEKSRIIHDIALWSMASAMLAWAINLWSKGVITPGEVVMVSALTFRILHGSRELAFALIGTTQQFAHIAETLKVVGQPHAVADAPTAAEHPPRTGAISFRDVAFTYPDGRKVFDGLSLDIPAGQKVGIAGPSGAGKSTFVSLVQRLDDAQRGHVVIDGRPVDQMTQDALRAAIAVVPQEISLFHRSVMENIRYARPDATDEQVHAAARAAYCDDFIRALPDGYDTMVGERGLKLSGGQRQRLGVARAILKDAPIVIFDEATSALDTESEILIQRALATLMEGRTVLAVAHRLSTIANFDRIIVLSHGKVVEDGSPRELRRRGGHFDALWRMQAESLTMEEPRADAA